VFVSPFFLLFGVFGAFPILFSLWISVHEWRGLRPGEFVGLRNYATLVADSQFRVAVTNTILLGSIYVPLMLVLSLGLAVLLNRPFRLRNVYRTGYFLPVITSLVVVGMLFGFLFGSPYSPISAVVRHFGVEYRGLLGEAWFIKPAIVIMLLWRWTGYNMMIMLAGLQSIPDELYEAARIDGAGGFRSFLHITVPMMGRVIAFAAILSTIGMFNLFDEVYVLVGHGGGVQQAGLVTGVFVYRMAFFAFRFGYASAVAYAVAFIIVSLSLVQLYISERTAA
jgi:cellobiose transport system permease protein